MPSHRPTALACLAMSFAAVAIGRAAAQPSAAPASAAAPAPDPTLQAVVASPARPAADRKRDVYRHPYASLTFWGLKPGTTVIDLQPGGGYWTEILAPYESKTGGVYVAGVADLDNPKTSPGARKSRATFEAKHADPVRYGRIHYVGFGPQSGPLAPAGTVDLILTSREIHNWIAGGYVDRAMADAYAALKPGGYLAVEDHRADPRPQKADVGDGYVATANVVAAAERAGFRLDASSEVNANPRDTKDYPFGVWTLPPTRESTADGKSEDPAFNHSRYDAIGESDRMTLRFRKPA